MSGTGRNRSQAMAARLLSPTAADDGPAHAVPNWLVAEQDAHKRPEGATARTGSAKDAAVGDNGGGGSGPTGSGSGGPGAGIGDGADRAAGRGRAKAKAKSRAKTKTRVEGDVSMADAAATASGGHVGSGEDFLMLDMLEAAHVPGAEVGGLAAAFAAGGGAVSENDGPGRNVSAEADSILSLPPLDEGSAARWQTRKAAAQEARAHARRASYAGAAAAATSSSALPVRSPPRKPRLSAPGGSSHVLSGAVVSGTAPLPGRPPGLASASTATPPVESARDVVGDSAAQPRAVPERPMRRDASEASLTASEASGKGGRAAEGVKSKHSRSHSRGHHRRRASVAGDLAEGRALDPERRESGPEDDASETRRAARRRLARRNEAVASAVYPHSWEWRRPADEDVIIPSGAWIYLAVIGWCSFACAFVINLCASLLSVEATDAVSFLGVALLGEGARRYVLAGLRAMFLIAAFLITAGLSPKFTSGSGIPEMKCVLSGIFMPAALSEWTLAAKVFGLIFSLASSVSIGRLGPFIHISGICAALVSKTGWFPVLTSSARFQLQAVSSAMAAGVGATFGAPIGGTMLAIELMSTYYFIHWMPMALYCSIMGYYLVAAVTPTDAEAYFSASIVIGRHDESLYKVVTYALLGCICGVVGALLVQYTVFMFQVRRRYFTHDTVVRTCIFLGVFAFTHSLVVSHFGGVLELSQRASVSALFNEKSSTKAWIRHSVSSVKATPGLKDNSWSSPASLFYAIIIKLVLTGVSLVLPVPAGTFMPIFEIGALLGRGFGELFSRFKWVTWIDPRATAIVGAAGVTAGSLHITSVAVVMLEITHGAVDILPLALGVIFAYGVSKHLCSDLFSELIKARRLPFILGLRERYPQENRTFYERVASVSAGNFMTREFALVTPASTVGEVRKLLGAEGTQKFGAWRVCAFLNNATDRHLYGVIPRSVLAEAVEDHSSNAPSPGPVSPNPLSSSERLGPSGRAPLLPVTNVPSHRAGSAGYGSFHDRIGERDRIQGSVETSKLSANALLPMLADYDRNYGHRNIDMGPMQVSIQTPFWKVATYFRMLGMNSIYVTQDGATVGLVTKAQVINYTFEEEDKALAERLQSAQEAREVAEMTAIIRGAGRLATGRASTASGSKVRLASRFSQSDLQSMAAHRVRAGPGRSSGHIVQTS